MLVIDFDRHPPPPAQRSRPFLPSGSTGASPYVNRRGQVRPTTHTKDQEGKEKNAVGLYTRLRGASNGHLPIPPPRRPVQITHPTIHTHSAERTPQGAHNIATMPAGRAASTPRTRQHNQTTGSDRVTVPDYTSRPLDVTVPSSPPHHGTQHTAAGSTTQPAPAAQGRERRKGWCGCWVSGGSTRAARGSPPSQLTLPHTPHPSSPRKQFHSVSLPNPFLLPLPLLPPLHLSARFT